MISVVIPTFNNASYLREAIDSVLLQKGVEVEVVVVDDGSTDATPEILSGYKGRIRSIRQENQGGGAARNRGFEASRGEYVLFLDADDFLLPGALLRLHKESRRAANVPCSVYGSIRTLQEPGQKRGRYPCRHREGWSDVEELLTHNILPGAVLHHRAAVETVGGFDPTLPRGQEFDFHLRMALAGNRFRFIDYPVLCYRVHASPHRISSGGFRGKDPLYYFQLHQKHLALLKEVCGEPLPSEVARAASGRVWDIGRGLLREGEGDAATVYFEEARRLYPEQPVRGRLPYRSLAKYLGPVKAERILSLLRR